MKNMRHSEKRYGKYNSTLPEGMLPKMISENKNLKSQAFSGEQQRIENSIDGQVIIFSNRKKDRRESARRAEDVSPDRVNAVFHIEKPEKMPGFANIIGQDKKMRDVFQQIIDVANYDYPVHVSGETGTGKELIAEAIHKNSPRRDKPFVPINCGALPEGLVESELFGHVKGAFSGAVRDKKGRFELADGGTVFLDEVAELSKFMQVKLLRFLQDGTFEKVGGEKTASVNVRVISATNKDLKEEIKKNLFRDDLYYRLNVIPIHLPALRDRKGDIRYLINHFVRQAEMAYKTGPIVFEEDAMTLLSNYRWPGNIRELQNAVQFAIVRSSDNTITPQHLPLEVKNSEQFLARRGPSKKLDTEVVAVALQKSGGNKAKASRYLGVGRATLYRFLDEHPEALG